jgi:hypothetical protein
MTAIFRLRLWTRARPQAGESRGASFAGVDGISGNTFADCNEAGAQALAKKHNRSASQEALTAIEHWLNTQKD